MSANTNTVPTFSEMLTDLKAQGKRPTIKDMLRMRAAPVLGEMVEVSMLAPELQAQPGLIALNDGDKRVAPTFQFEQRPNGDRQLNPRLAIAWQLFSLLQIDQIKEDEWATATRLAGSNPAFGGRTTAEALMDPNTPDETVNQFYADVVIDAIHFGKVHGVKVVDPRTRLPHATPNVYPEMSLVSQVTDGLAQLPPAK